jgi:hypothetical protein
MNAEQKRAAHEAFQAYNAMETTKRRHFDFLTMLETAAKKWNIQPSAEQNAMRAALLDDHDQQVKSFKAQSSELRARDPAAFAALWVYIGEINSSFQPLHESQQH